MFRHNRNETNKNQNIRPNAVRPNCKPGCQGNACADQNPITPERDTFIIEPPIEEGGSNDSFSIQTPRNLRRNPDDEEFFPQFIQRGPIYPPEFRATQITRIQTRIMDDDEEEEECDCPNDNKDGRSAWPPPKMRTTATPIEASMLQFSRDSILMKPNLAFNRNSALPQFATDENHLIATSVPFVPKREPMVTCFDESGDPGASVSYLKEFGNLVTRQLDNLETRFIVYKVKMRGSKSLRAILMKKKYLLLSIPLALFLLWLALLLGVLIGSVYCNGMEDCPWAKGTTMAPRLLYSPHSVF